MSTDTRTASPDIQPILQGCWRIDPARSRVEFRTPTLWGLATVTGHFEHYAGSLDLQRSPAIELTVDATSLNTSNRLRDRHLRSADFFDADNHPEVRFASDTVTVEGKRLRIRGRLDAAASSLPIELEAELGLIGDEVAIEARTSVNHLALGMSRGMLGMIRPPSELIVQGRLVR